MAGKQSSKRRRIDLQSGEETPYEVLGVSETATEPEIRRAYLRMVRLSPPEKDPEGFKRIRTAYGLLIDSEKKRELDLSLFQTESRLVVDDGAEYDYRTLVQNRLLQLLLSSSDFYTKDFARRFISIDERIVELE